MVMSRVSKVSRCWVSEAAGSLERSCSSVAGKRDFSGDNTK